MRNLVLVFSLALLGGAVLAGQSQAPNGNEMPLELYQKLKGCFDTLYGAQVSLLPGLAPANLKGDADKTLREAAAATLAKLPDAAAVEALLKGLSDNSDSVRGLCATALGNTKDNRAAEPLLKLLATDSKPIVRLQAATALSKIKDKATLEGLVKALENEKDERVKLAIAGAVRNILGGETA